MKPRIFLLVGLGLCVVILAVLAAPGHQLFPVAFAEESEGDEPPYPHGEYEADCAMCHGPEGWVPAVIGESFDHSEFGFGLDGAHGSTPCQSCHVSLEFNRADSACGACHQDVHRGELGNDCAMCHTTRNFIDRPAEVRAHRMTRFPLTGAHATVDCDACHTMARGGRGYVNTPVECESCHLDDFMATREPNHVQAGFDKNCEMCHSVFTWQGAGLAGFNHSATGFPLTGAHIGAPCTNCHTSGSFGVIPSDCNSCHADDYQQAPGHVSGSFALTCEDCHSTLTWSGAAFNHDFFPFTGGHSGLDCLQCHTSGTTGPIPADCFFCHMPEFQQAPGHVSSGFPTTCEDCHTITTWPNATFAHDFFPLTGGHNAVPCVQCHTTGTFGPIPADCFSCHNSDFQQAPGHVSSGFPTTCEDCHTITTWLNATFAHDFFPLTGGHNAVPCIQCHTSGTFGTIPANCFSCHEADYQTALDHVALNFPTDCESCHNIINWQNVDFNHSPFKISSGPHDKPCSDCHIQGTTSTFSCEGACHKHTQSEMDDTHSGVSGYVFEFNQCFACHPTGKA